MLRWLIHRLASVLPPAIDSDNEQMRFSTTQKRLFLREARFLFFSANGPVEFCVRPAHIFAGFGGGVGLAALIFLTPVLPSLPSLSSLPTVNSVKQMTTSFASLSNHRDQEGTVSDWTSALKGSIASSFLNSRQPAARDKTVLSGSGTLPASDISAEQAAENSRDNANTSLIAMRQAIIIGPPEYTDIEEPNDELITTTTDEADTSDPIIAKQQTHTIAVPAARPAPEPMDPEFVSFDGLNNPPIQTPRMKLNRRFANVMSEVDRIKVMLDRLGITPDRAPEQWNPSFTAVNENVSALYLYRDNWRELLHMLPLQAPLRYYYVTSPYGMRTNKKTGVSRFHHGVDLAGTWKAKLRPPASGIVTFAGRDGGFGKVVRVQHAHGIETVYAHLSSVLVSKGSFVTAQDVIGTMGNTGYSDGMHLHYEIRIDGKSKDPEDFFAYGHKLTITGALSGEM